MQLKCTPERECNYTNRLMGHNRHIYHALDSSFAFFFFFFFFQVLTASVLAVYLVIPGRRVLIYLVNATVVIVNKQVLSFISVSQVLTSILYK